MFSSVPELGEEGGSGVRGPVLFHPPPNCRIREVHCGTQVRLVVIAIRDIAKGEEITVDYSLTDWGENAMVSYRLMETLTCLALFCICLWHEKIKAQQRMEPSKSFPYNCSVS